ncbi:glycosyltransferase family 2 protein, partial [Escherichia coli]|uniref:glycosyltransferase family 2 protein n=1 Tax=Escherichia coli TaxID=562 RepID=UPI001FCCED73
MNKETVSIIMPVYNGAKTIISSVESIIHQSYQDFVLYIIDDCSTDDTFSLINSRYKNNQKIRILRNKTNLGVAESRNYGIEMATGKYISFCDADDLWHEKKLERQIEVLNNECVDVVCSNYYVIDNKRNIVGEVNAPHVINYRKMLMKNYIGNLTGIYNANKLGKFYQKKIGHEDYLMWLEIINKTNGAICIQDLSFINLSDATSRTTISYDVFRLKKKRTYTDTYYTPYPREMCIKTLTVFDCRY